MTKVILQTIFYFSRLILHAYNAPSLAWGATDAFPHFPLLFLGISLSSCKDCRSCPLLPPNSGSIPNSGLCPSCQGRIDGKVVGEKHNENPFCRLPFPPKHR